MSVKADQALPQEAQDQINDITGQAQREEITWEDANKSANGVRAKYGADYSVSRDGVTTYHDGSTIDSSKNGGGVTGDPGSRAYDTVYGAGTAEEANRIFNSESGGSTTVRGNQTASRAPTAPSAPQIDPLQHIDTTQMESNLEQQRDLAIEQSNKQVDYATQRGVEDLNRAEQDAQSQFQTAQNQIDIDEARAKDNQALYAEARGDRGGIGAAQYSAIQNNAAQNRMAVRQQQIKLSTDTQRQIADLRAQGEFQKADAVLQVTQNYLAQLQQLQQWAIQMNMSVDQFNVQLQQWFANWQMQLYQIENSNYQWSQEFGLSQEQFAFNKDMANREFAFGQQQYADSQQQNMAAIGKAMLDSGMPVSALTPAQLEALRAMGIDPNAYADGVKMSMVSAGKVDNSGDDKQFAGGLDYDGLFEAALESGHPETFFNQKGAYSKYGFSDNEDLLPEYEKWLEDRQAEAKKYQYPMTEDEWKRRKSAYLNTGKGGTEVADYDTYSAYRAARDKWYGQTYAKYLK